ncbi:DNA polymerase theta-like [Phytophthora palmivora]|uniref:DNA polymerase theta-like n=1 Tax=Phytophthora palmivora TaxID=4796 RepID=A0A2P4XA94_9STRA|nr:DNA polymerase theta-like [Phytophthora palmivora]
MTGLAKATVTADIPVALVEYSNGMVMLYDVRIAEVIGSIRTLLYSTVHVNPPSTQSCSTMSIMNNQEVLVVIATISTPSYVNLYRWRDILLVCFPFFAEMLEQRQEELTSSNVKQLFLSNDSAVHGSSVPVPPSSVTTQGASVDLLETMFLRMAGELPSSSPQASRSKKSIASPLQSPVRQSSLLHDPSSLTVSSQIAKDVFQRQMMGQSATSVMLEPLVSDNKVFFEQYCRENLDPLVIVDKEAKLHRKRRELLKVMSAGGAW